MDADGIAIIRRAEDDGAETRIRLDWREWDRLAALAARARELGDQ